MSGTTLFLLYLAAGAAYTAFVSLRKNPQKALAESKRRFWRVSEGMARGGWPFYRALPVLALAVGLALGLLFWFPIMLYAVAGLLRPRSLPPPQ